MYQAPSLIPSNTEKWRGGRREGRSKNIKENKNRWNPEQSQGWNNSIWETEGIPYPDYQIANGRDPASKLPNQQQKGSCTQTTKLPTEEIPYPDYQIAKLQISEDGGPQPAQVHCSSASLSSVSFPSTLLASQDLVPSDLLLRQWEAAGELQAEDFKTKFWVSNVQMNMKASINCKLSWHIYYLDRGQTKSREESKANENSQAALESHLERWGDWGRMEFDGRGTKILIFYTLNLSCPLVIYMESQQRWLEVPTQVELKKESQEKKYRLKSRQNIEYLLKKKKR